MDVAIVGIGMHRFGRTEGVSGRQQGANAARAALADAGIGWEHVQFAAGGSLSAGAADALVADLGLTGLSFINVSNGCATGGSALTVAANAITSGSADVAIAIGFDKHDRGAFNADPEDFGLGAWYGRTGLMLTTQFFATEDHAVHRGARRRRARIGAGRRAGVPQRLAQRNGLAPKAAVRRRHPGQPR